jgi:small GTP-binding protein
MGLSERILRPDQQERVTAVRRVMHGLSSALVRLRAATDDERTAVAAARQIDELFLLVIVGEFNAGKSAFINALIGERVLEEGVTPTTARIQILQYGNRVERTQTDGLDVATAPMELLRDLHIVDTPGTNAIVRHHEALTREFVPRADLVLFVTSADRPFTESERAFLESIRQWGKKVVLVINKIDILETPSDVASVVEFVSRNVRALLGFVPEVFPVAARLAMQAKRNRSSSGEAGAAPSAEAWQASRFEALERYVVNTLDADERLRLKLLNPLGVALRLSGKYLEVIDERLELLRGDLGTIEEIQAQLQEYRRDLQNGFRLRLAKVDNVLHELQQRADKFFEEEIRLARLFDLMNKSKLKADFEREVIADSPREIEQSVGEIIDWMVNSDLKQWEAVRDHLMRRRSEHSERLAGKFHSGFEYDRARLLDTVGKTAQRTFEDYDTEAEATRMAESVQVALLGTAMMEVGAVGLGTAVTVLTTTTAVDVTGILAASVLAALGLFVIPHRRGAAKREFRAKIEELRSGLTAKLNQQFEREVERSLGRIREAIEPYSRFVRAEKETLTGQRDELGEVNRHAASLVGQLEAGVS